MEEKLLNVVEIAKYLRFNTQTVYRMVEKNEIPYIRVRNSLRFKQSDIDNWLKTVKER